MGSKPIDMPLLAAELAPTTEPVPEPLPEPTQDGWGLAKTATGLVAILLLGGVAMGLLPIPGLGSAQGPAPAPAAIEQPATPSIARLSLIQPVAAAEFERAIGGMLLS